MLSCTPRTLKPAGPQQPLLGREDQAPAIVVALAVQRHLSRLEFGCEGWIRWTFGPYERPSTPDERPSIPALL